MIALRLAHIEWLKARRRFVFWTASLFFFGVLLVGLGGGYWEHLKQPALRSGRPVWDPLIDIGTSLGMLIVLVIVALLTASERNWRTERQNVIDGLSRTQYFAAKLIMTAGVVLLLWGGVLLLGAVFSGLERALVEAPEPPFMTGLQAKMLGGLLLYLVLTGAIAFFFGTVASSSGAALGLAFVFLMAEAPIMMLMAHRGGAWLEATAYFPFQVLMSLTSDTAYMPEEIEQIATGLREAGMPIVLGAPQAALVAAAYAGVLAAGAWLSIRRRDL